MRPVVAPLLAACCFVPVAAAGQEASLRARPEVAGTMGLLVVLPTFGVSGAVPLGSYTAFESGLEYAPITFDEVPGAHFLFVNQLRTRVRDGRRWDLHATAGITVATKYTYATEFTRVRSDGSTAVIRRAGRFGVEDGAPLHGGIGGRRAGSNGTVVRWDIQGLVFPGDLAIWPRATFSIAWGASR